MSGYEGLPGGFLLASVALVGIWACAFMELLDREYISRIPEPMQVLTRKQVFDTLQ